MTMQPGQSADAAAQPSAAVSATGAAATWTRRKPRGGDASGAAPTRSQQIIAYALLLAGSLVFLVPFYFVLNGSLKTDAEVQAGDFIRPVFLNPPEPGTLTELSAAPDVVQKAIATKIGADSALRGLYVSGPAPAPSEPDSRVYTARLEHHGELSETRYLADGSVRSSVVFERGPHWTNYPKALAPDHMNFLPALANTVVITVLCVLGQVLSCSLVGFGFARFHFRGRTLLFMIMLSTMMLPAQVTMIPVFILFKSLHLVDSFWPLIIPSWLASPFFVFMFRQFFSQIPEELVEAARIDGAGNWRIYWQLMMPLCGPVIAIVSIYTFLGAWNDFLGPLIYLNSGKLRTITLALNAFKGQYGGSDAQLLMAASVVCMLPCVVLFFAAQKYFVESVAMTGLKS